MHGQALSHMQAECTGQRASRAALDSRSECSSALRARSPSGSCHAQGLNPGSCICVNTGMGPDIPLSVNINTITTAKHTHTQNPSAYSPAWAPRKGGSWMTTGLVGGAAGAEQLQGGARARGMAVGTHTGGAGVMQGADTAMHTRIRAARAEQASMPFPQQQPSTSMPFPRRHASTQMLCCSPESFAHDQQQQWTSAERVVSHGRAQRSQEGGGVSPGQHAAQGRWWQQCTLEAACSMEGGAQDEPELRVLAPAAGCQGRQGAGQARTAAWQRAKLFTGIVKLVLPCLPGTGGRPTSTRRLGGMTFVDQQRTEQRRTLRVWTNTSV